MNTLMISFAIAIVLFGQSCAISQPHRTTDELPSGHQISSESTTASKSWQQELEDEGVIFETNTDLKEDSMVGNKDISTKSPGHCSHHDNSETTSITLKNHGILELGENTIEDLTELQTVLRSHVEQGKHTLYLVSNVPPRDGNITRIFSIAESAGFHTFHYIYSSNQPSND